MEVPPFPPQDLAKLVLGYLAEEELMTAYDEFLQASPYLDAFKNEYDRIFMTSLRSVLADYRAVKIYVETCKPNSLRKRLVQCFSLLEMFKYLISIADIQKLPQDLGKNRNQTQVQPSKGMTIDASIADNPVTILPSTTNTSQKELGIEQRKSTEYKDLYTNTQKCAMLPGVIGMGPAESQDNRNSPAVNMSQITPVVDSRQKIEEFNTILNLVCNKNVTNDKLCDNLVSNKSNTTFQEFATGVHGNNYKKKTTIPDSSTREFTPIVPKPLEMSTINTKGPPNTVSFHSPVTSSQVKTTEMIERSGDRKSKDNKIKILSDVRFDTPQQVSQPKTLFKGTVTTSLHHMQKLIINGTPGNKSDSANKINYSKDEIMAMPTIIIVPTSGSSYNIVTSTKGNIPAATLSTTTAKPEPIFVDVSSSMPLLSEPDKDSNQETNFKDGGLLKTVNTLVHASLPKDSTSLCKTSTPHALPPMKKSSSTPRRSSHIRVLDFNTPRRILDKGNLEKDPSSDDNVVVITDSPVTSVPESIDKKHKDNFDNVKKKLDTHMKTTPLTKKPDWDEKLRALVTANEDLFPPVVPKKKTKKDKQKPSSQLDSSKKTEASKKTKSKKKSNSSTDKVTEQTSERTKEKTIKPTINIVSAKEPCLSEQETENNMNTDNFDTPETERLSLQNEIGAKLNISDLLETPYKQAIYDIQMETPRFLGPDLPGEPISNIKITDIPTPRFLDTPKPVQATPSSYSSRPTDYSSGGSYYKPDDQDYNIPGITQPDELDKTTKKEETGDSSKKDKSEIKHKTKRPTRKCAKNVSYYNNPVIVNQNKSKSDDSGEETPVAPVITPRDKKRGRPVKNKTNTTKVEKYKSPFKKEAPKNFMKIKPRRITPVKDTKRKSLSDLNTRKRNNSIKDKNITPIPEKITTKSRRKSSTPRKLQCTKTFHSSTSSNTSPDVPAKITSTAPEERQRNVQKIENAKELVNTPVDNVKSNHENEKNENSIRDAEDSITKIKEYIESINTKTVNINSPDKYSARSFHNDLVKRGLDSETAKIIERDLLDTPPLQDGAVQSTSNEENVNEKASIIVYEQPINKAEDKNKETENSDDEYEDLEFTVHENNEDTNNYFVSNFDEANFTPKNIEPLKDKFCMEVCIDDGVTLRLRSTPYKALFDVSEEEYNKREIDTAVSSISNIDKLYTPIKDHRAQCYEIFDSTLTSIDTPLKENSPKRKVEEELTTEIVIEVENLSKTDNKKRKRVQSSTSDEGSNMKKNKTDNQYLLNPANIQNIDIESVLSKLHGP